MTGEWEVDRLDLDAYLHRVGEPGGPPTAATLGRLHQAHVAAVPFENLDVVLGRGVSVDLASVQDKLVSRRRGGYCYEHGVLFAAALERLGFGVDRLLARIGYDPDRPRPRTHMTLHVSGHDGQWLADVGFGAGLLTPLPWADGEQHQDGWTYRLTTDEDGVTRRLQEDTGQGWSALYSFTDERVHASDVEMANHYTATHPSSPFVGRLVAMRRSDQRRTRLLGRTLQVTRPHSPPEEREVSDDELPDTLRHVFGIPLTDDEQRAVVAHLHRR